MSLLSWSPDKPRGDIVANHSQATVPRESWPPAALNSRAICFELRISDRQCRRLLASGRLPPADFNISPTGDKKGRRWWRDRLLARVAAGLLELQHDH